jgi:uncharacterized protein
MRRALGEKARESPLSRIMKILISGASGFVGTHLARVLEQQGHTVGRLVRPRSERSRSDVSWDPPAATIDTASIEGTDAVVHLSGANIAHRRWTDQQKALLRSSRVDSTRVLVDALARLEQRPRVFVCASATGYYGDRGEEILTESSEPGTDFLSLLARDWEAEALRAEHSGMRTVRLRFGMILSADGGALPRMLLPFRLGIGGRFGSGRQWMSWIALDDAVQAVCLAVVDTSVNGPVNVVSPNPVRNAEFVRVLANVLDRPALFPAPALALRLALGEMADPLLLASQRVRPTALLAMKFPFRYPDLGASLPSLLPRPT